MKKKTVLIFLIITALLATITVVAIASNLLGDIMDAIVGKNNETEKLDYNGNGEIDIIDAILEEKGAEISVYPSNNRVPTSLKILSIGNSFSEDGMSYLYQVAKSMGVEDVVLGNMYIGGCTLDMHYQHAVDDDGAYPYYKNTSGSFNKTSNVKFSTCIKDEEWDIITFQQASRYTGKPETYTHLSELVSIVDGLKTNNNVKYFWHFTWAAAADYSYVATYYNNSQMEMYTCARDCVLNIVNKDGRFSGVIPSGTAIQNARTSFVGDRLNRDGLHLDLTLGRYIASLSYYAAITGNDISDISFVPSIDINTDAKNLAIESVTNAMKYTYSVTESQYKEGSWTPATELNKTVVAKEDCFEYDKYLASSVGVDLANYCVLEYTYVTNSNYYCPDGTNPQYSKSTQGTYNRYVRTEKIFTKEEIPEGSVIICDAGWQFRPELWTDMETKNLNRHSNVGNGVLLLDESFWGDFNLIGLNISTSDSVDYSSYFAAGPSHVRIYIPNN